MYGQSQQQQVKMLANSIGYFNTPLTVSHITDFLNKNQSFAARQTVRCSNDDNYFSFIELNGYILIGNILFQALIGVPRNYPQSAPIFMINFNRQYHGIFNEQQLIKDQVIAVEKNDSGDEFIRLRLPVLEREWNPSYKTLVSVFNEVMQIINRPPIIAEINAPKINRKEKPARQKPSFNNEEVTRVIQNLQNQGQQTIAAKNQLHQAQISLDYSFCRQKFLLDYHLPKLIKKLQSKTENIASIASTLEEDLSMVEAKRNCDSMFNMSVEDEEKLEILSEQQALKDAEVKLRSKIEGDDDIKFGEFKKVMKVLYDKMFDNQTKLLRSMQ